MSDTGWLGGLPWLQPHEGAVRRWYVRREGTYEGARGDRWTIPVGWHTDLASIPWWARWLVDTWGAHTGAALLHDWLRHLAREMRTMSSAIRLDGPQAPVTEREADGLFRRTLRLGGTPAPLRWLMFLAVRIDSGFSDGMDRDEWLRCAAVLPLGLLVVLVSLSLFPVRWLVDGLGRITERTTA